MKDTTTLSFKDLFYYEKAEEISLLSTFDRVKFGCVAVYKGRIIGSGYNSDKTHPMQLYYNRYRDMNHTSIIIHKIHAEIMCINKIKKLDIDMSKVHLYIFRRRKDTDFGMGRPCNACMMAIKDSGIKHIHYTTNDGYVHEIIKE